MNMLNLEVVPGWFKALPLGAKLIHEDQARIDDDRKKRAERISELREKIIEVTPSLDRAVDTAATAYKKVLKSNRKREEVASEKRLTAKREKAAVLRPLERELHRLEVAQRKTASSRIKVALDEFRDEYNATRRRAPSVSEAPTGRILHSGAREMAKFSEVRSTGARMQAITASIRQLMGLDIDTASPTETDVIERIETLRAAWPPIENVATGTFAEQGYQR